jgi:diaminopimelate decarboxylase
VRTERVRDEERTDENKKTLVVIAEPGRFFCSSAFTLVVSVIGKKERDIEDSGELIKQFEYTINHGKYASFGCITYDFQQPIIIPYNNNDKKRYESIIWGPSCDSLDFITKNAKLPELLIEDRLYVENMGAYTISSSSSFNGFHNLKNYYVFY